MCAGARLAADPEQRLQHRVTVRQAVAAAAVECHLDSPPNWREHSHIALLVSLPKKAPGSAAAICVMQPHSLRVGAKVDK